MGVGPVSSGGDFMLHRLFSAKKLAVSPRRRAYHLLDLADHLEPAPTKRILSLDGGGVRGAMTLAVLEKIEKMLRRRHGNHGSFRLADYYDLIGGTSSGAIIASTLASRGYTASDVKEIYQEIVPRVFKRPAFSSGGPDHPKFNGKRLLKIMEEVLGGMTLGDERFNTGLAIIARRVDTDETLIMHNHPNGKYYDDPADRHFVGNRHYPLARVVRASAGAPYVFAPQKIELVQMPRKETGLFIDGGTTQHNNPAFKLFLLATVKAYGFVWNKGADNLLMTSIGTGRLTNNMSPEKMARLPSTLQTKEALTSMVDSSERWNELLMQLISDPQSPQWIDQELENLAGVHLSDQPQCNYQRYQAHLNIDSLRRDFGIALTVKQLQSVRNMTDKNGFQIAYEIGQAVADKMVKEEHFPEGFNLPAAVATPTEPMKSDTPLKPVGVQMMPEPTRPLAPSVRGSQH